MRLSAGDWQSLAYDTEGDEYDLGYLRRSVVTLHNILTLVFVWEGSVGFVVASRGRRTQPETPEG